MRTLRPSYVILSIALAALAVGCGRGRTGASQGDDVFAGGRPATIEAAQAALVNTTSLEQGRQLVQTLERPRRAEEGVVRGEINLSRSTINYYSTNPEAAAAQFATLDLGDEPLSIVDYGPSGLLPMENARPRIYVMFSQPMVPLTSLGEVIAESQLLSIEPEVPGVYRWYGTKTLSFEPEAPLTRHPSYEVSVTGEETSLGGNALERRFSFRIYTERLEIANVYAGTPGDPYVDRYDVPIEYAKTLIVEFNQTVDVEVIRPFLAVEANGDPLGFTLARPDYPDELESRTDRAVKITLDADPPEQSRLRIIVREGARPREGFPETVRGHTHFVRTIAGFRADRLTAFRGAFPMDNRSYNYPVFLDFSHPLADDAAEKEFTVTLDGEVIEPSGIDQHYSNLRFFIPNARPDQIVAVTVPPTVSDVYGRELGREEHLSYTIPRPEPMIEFPSHYDGLRHLEAEFDPSIVFNMRNIVGFRLGVEGGTEFFGNRNVPTPVDFDISAHTPDYVHFHEIDLKPYLNDDRRGTVFFNWAARKDPALVSNSNYRTESDAVAVQVTDLGISTRFAYNRILVWVNRLSDGTPVPGAAVEVFNLQSRRFTGQTDAAGLAAVEIPGDSYAASFFTDDRTSDDDMHIRVRSGADTAELRVSSTHNSYRFGPRSVERATEALERSHRVHLFTDRGLYQPGEEFAFRGIHWLQNAQGFTPFRDGYAISIEGIQSESIVWSDDGSTSASGGFSGRIALPGDMEYGDYVLRYRYGAGRYEYQDVRFQVGSFRRVSFEVTSLSDSDEIIAGKSASVSIAASYLAGGAVAGASYEYFWMRRPVRYVPPGPQWEAWTVGTSEWGRERRLTGNEGSMSAAGTASIGVATAEHELEGKPYRYSLEVRVEDVDRQVVAHDVSLLVHPADHYVAARFSQGSSEGWWSSFVPTGDKVVAEARLVGIDGGELDRNGTIRYGLVKGEWRSAQQQGLYGRLNQRWEYVEETLYEEEGSVSDGRFRHEFSVDDPGRYTLFFVSTDAVGRPTRTEIPFYATGSGWVQTASQTPSDIDMVVDKSIYEPGETARILVQSPLAEGRYLLTIEREGILDQRVIELSGSNEVIEIPVKADYVPVFYVALTSFTERTATEDDYFHPDLGKPRGLFGLTTVSVSTSSVELDVSLATDSASYGSGDEGDVTVRVTQNGRPVADAEVTVLGVDRGVLDLIDYRVPNPLDYFYDERHFPLSVEGDDSRRLLLRPVTYEISSLQGGAGEAKLDERTDFSPLALFEPAVRTDRDGYARLTFDYPDNLTTYRFTAVALAGNRLGLTEHEVRVQNPINVRTALPRRFRSRDTAIAGVVLTNTTDVEQQVDVTAESDILLIADQQTKSITIPAESVYELPFVLEAHDAGDGVIRFTTRSPVLGEVLEKPVIVEQPLVTEAFTTFGMVDDVTEDGGGRATEGLLIPSQIAQAYGSLTIGLDTSVQAHILPSIANLELVSGTPASDIRRLYDLSIRVQGLRPAGDVAGIVGRLEQHQFPNGGIGYRPPTTDYSRPSLFVSLLTEQVLQQADRSGVPIDHALDRRALRTYLRSELDLARMEERAGFAAAWNAAVLAAVGFVSPGDLAFLREAGDELGIAGNALLAEAFLTLREADTARRIYARARNFVVIGTQTVDIRETYEARGYFDSGEPELALMLRIGTLLDESDELLIRFARSLARTKTDRRFSSFHDDFWIVHGFAPLVARESGASEVGAEVRLGGETLVDRRLDAEAREAFEQHYPLFEGRLAEVPRDELVELDFLRKGGGELYYTNTLRYALPSETAVPRDEGIEVRRQIETLDGEVIEGEVLPLGKTLRMRVFVSTTRRQSYLNLQVPLPSGAEILDPTLKTTGSYADAGGVQSEESTRETVYGDTVTVTGDGYASYGPGGWWFWFYRPIQRIYDNAMLYTWEDFYAGDRDVSFLFRTTTPGVYPTPPVQASLEFEPEVFGQSGGRLYVIREE